MDLYCVTCGEPWDMDSLHEEAEVSGRSVKEVARDFGKRGCLALETAFGKQDCRPTDSPLAAQSAALFAVLGDDVDGVAAMMDDLAGGF